jgi:hypothetical protein
VWQPLPPGWHEAHDPVTNQQYYFHPASGSKTWARPIVALAPGADNPVTATRVVSTEQPLHLQGSRRRRVVSAALTATGASTPVSAQVSSADVSEATLVELARTATGGDDMDV